jgi:type I restriction enzyme, S subunit
MRPKNTLGELCSLITDGKHGDCRNEDNSGYYFVSCKDVKEGRIHYENARQIVHADFAETHRRTDLRPGDILLTNSGTIGRLAIAPDDGKTQRTTFQKSVAVLKPIPERVTSHFLYYSLAADRTRLINAAGGAAQKNLLLGELRRFPIRVPQLEEQARIASVLSAYDDLIENNRQRIQLLEQAAQLLYKEWFVRLRFPGHEHVTIADGLPEGWRRASLQEVCSRITDGSHSSPQSVDEGHPMASVKDMHDWGFNTDECRLIGQQDYDLLVRNDCKPLRGDVLIAKDGSYLKHTFVVQEEIDLVILSSIAILRPNHLIEPHLLNFILRDPQTKQRMAGYVSGVALPRIILKEFRDFRISLPPAELQLLWGKHADPLATQCHQLCKLNRALAQARDLLLPRLMNGDVSV